VKPSEITETCQFTTPTRQQRSNLGRLAPTPHLTISRPHPDNPPISHAAPQQPPTCMHARTQPCPPLSTRNKSWQQAAGPALCPDPCSQLTAPPISPRPPLRTPSPPLPPPPHPCRPPRTPSRHAHPAAAPAGRRPASAGARLVPQAAGHRALLVSAQLVVVLAILLLVVSRDPGRRGFRRF
jgi:hypothetical protein